MPKKKLDTQEVIEKIFDYTLEDLMGERFGSYSKYIIQIVLYLTLEMV